MTKYSVLLSESAREQLLSLSDEDIKRIKSRLKNLEDDPFRSRPTADIKKLIGSFNPSLYRLRVGDYRVVYTIVETDVKVTEIMHRSRGYAWLD